jgi:DnaD/phage-associated family protein
MPNRIIKETLCSSEKIALLKDFDFRLWISLILLADDYGLGDARPAIIKGRAFPLRDRLTNKEIECSLKNLAAASCVNLYEVDGRPYYQFLNWSQHQQIRARKSKYPSPNGTCNQMISDDIKCPRNPIQSESNPNPNPSACADAADDDRPSFDTVEAYAANNLAYLSPGNMEELADFKTDLPDELIRNAIDKACANGARKWGYVKAILNGYLDAGYKTIGDVKAAEQQRDNAKTVPKTDKTEVTWWN